MSTGSAYFQFYSITVLVSGHHIQLRSELKDTHRNRRQVIGLPQHDNAAASYTPPPRAARVLAPEGTLDRKEWIETRIEKLAQIFAVDVVGFFGHR
jgi:hypothetical protein